MPIDRSFDWQFVDETVRTGPMHMALEEVAARRVSEGGAAMLRVFRWEPSTLSLGYGQDEGTVDWAFCSSNGIDVTRRQTGGGGIYHDHDGDLSYSVVIPRDAVAGELLEAYHTLCEPILAFFDRLGIPAAFAERPRDAIYEPACFLRDVHPAHDIVVDGRKISGNAQYRQRDAVIQHGSIIYRQAVDRHLGVFRTDIAPATFTEHVTSVREHAPVERSEAVATMTAALRDWSGASDRPWTDDELAEARQLAEEKYAADPWVRSADFAV